MNNSEKKNIKRVSKFVFSKWIHFTLTSPLSYRETLPTRSIDVDLTFIVDEQRLSIKNVLETNNDFGETEKDDSNGKESLVLRQSKQLTRDPSTVYMFVARDLEKILILYDFFFSFSVHLCVFTIFSFSLILWYRHGIEKSSYARSSYATVIYNKLEIGPNI